jgi:hypothetical protein
MPLRAISEVVGMANTYEGIQSLLQLSWTVHGNSEGILIMVKR